MKKTLKYLSMLLVAALVVTGCGKESTKSSGSENETQKNVSFEEALKNTLENTNMKFSLDTEIGIKSEGGQLDGLETTSGKINLTGSIDSKKNINSTIKITQTTDEGTQDEMGTIYMDFSNKKVYTASYKNESDEKNWYVQELETKENTNNKLDATKFLEYVKESKKVDSDKEGYDKYEVTIDLLKASGSTDEEYQAIVQTFKISDATMYMYVKGKYIAYISYDFSDLLSETMGQIITLMMTMNPEQSTTTEVPKISIVFKGTIELTDQGKVEDIVIPEDVVKNAKTGVAENFEITEIIK